MKKLSPLLTVILIIAIAAFFLIKAPGNAQQSTVNQGEAGVSGQVIQTGQAAIGGAFTLTDTNGDSFTEQQLLGKTSLVFFGFTHCPDICPTGLAAISQALQDPALSDKAIQAVFITVDPARDTAEVIKEYLAAFDVPIIGLTGSDAQIKQVQQAYKVYSQKADNSQPDEHAAHSTGHGEHDNGHEEHYSMDHSSFIYVMDKQGKYVTHMSHNEPVASMVKTLQQYVY